MHQQPFDFFSFSELKQNNLCLTFKSRKWQIFF